MSATSLALVLTAALLHAVWNIAAKRVVGDGYVFVWFYDVLSAIVWLPIALAVLASQGWPLTWSLLWAPIVSGVIHIAYQLWLQTGYDRADLGVVYPLARGVGPLLTMLVAVVFGGERPGPAALLGGLVIIAGIVVVASAQGGERHHSVAGGLKWGALTGAAIAGYTLWDDVSVTHLGLDPVVYFALGTAWQTVLLTPGLERSRRAGAEVAAICRRWWREAAVIAVMSPLAYVLVLVAMQSTPVALVAPARESSIVVGALLGAWMFKERGVARKLVGALVVLAGIALVASA
ncbi:EamA family transporter [Dermacoccus nishinomiyaensis]|uniref:EamA family transporter n=1 Tax=Dermacoccus nishinomiyaensis TaxID=1274 RepID=UPI0013F3E6AD|nr:EamA family transporter [Dermacoccus nishinomiyaensis]NHC32835.1 EamA family transporter [Dermacoccus nishinomiyaensis]